jgi:hypothetical protein
VQVAQFDALLQAGTRNEGTVAAFGPGQVLAVFGGPEPERDDVLRAVVAGLEWRELWLDSRQDGPSPIILVDLETEESTAPQRLEKLNGLLVAAPTTADLPIYLSPAAQEAAHGHLETRKAGELHLVTEAESSVSGEVSEDLD